MIPPSEAVDKILKEIGRLGSELVPLSSSIGRVLAEDLRATTDLPPFDTTAVDGFAVKSKDVAAATKERPGVLKLREVLRAGARADFQLSAGEATQIMTGAPMPSGADAVVMKEISVLSGRDVQILQAPETGENVRQRGEDIKEGSLLLQAGTLIRPYEIALLASQGFAEVPSVRRPRVGVIATGDELVPVGQPLSPGKIRNSNGPAIAAAVGRWGAEPLDSGIVPDDPGKIEKAMIGALDRSDVLLVSGGVSVGDFDYTKVILEKLGLKIAFWKVAMKPGKPLLFGTCRNKPVFGLPGNPVSVLVCLEEFVRPALERMSGHSPKHPSYHLSGKAANEYFKDPEKQNYLFCRVSEEGEGFSVEIIRPQGSHMMGMASSANALAVAPIGVRHIQKGSVIKFRWLK